MTEDEMVGWHHQLDGHESEQAPGVWCWTRKPGVLQSKGISILQHHNLKAPILGKSALFMGEL